VDEDDFGVVDAVEVDFSDEELDFSDEEPAFSDEAEDVEEVDEAELVDDLLSERLSLR
jgi:hypothetical protein